MFQVNHFFDLNQNHTWFEPKEYVNRVTYYVAKLFFQFMLMIRVKPFPDLSLVSLTKILENLKGRDLSQTYVYINIDITFGLKNKIQNLYDFLI